MKKSLFQQHVEKWKNCQRCPLCQNRKRVIFARGNIPCDVLFVGEAPGSSEDVLGRPFVGPAGKLLDFIIEESVGEDYTYALTNLVSCIPKDDSGSKIEPNKLCISECRPKLEEIIKFSNPKLIVAVGKLSQKHVPELGAPKVTITHPAAILRMDLSQKDLAIKRCRVVIKSALDVYLK